MSSPSEILGPHGPLAHALPGYEHRPGQMRMADAVEAALTHGGIALIEAGTGTGKTLAYLIPAILSGKRVIVSTGTRALQDQLMDHDLPMLREHLGVSFKAACMKGLANYLCVRRYGEFRASAAASTPSLGRQLKVLEPWRETTVTGDRSDLVGLAEDASLWPYVQSGSDTRIGARCSHHAACFVTKMRKRAEAAQIVVVNHHLFFADLAMRGPHGARVLPDYDTVIFDEAHSIEDIATMFFGTEISTGRFERLARDAEAGLVASGGDIALTERMRQASENFFRELPPLRQGDGGRMTLPRGTFTDVLEQRFFALDDAIEALGAHCRLRSRKRGSAVKDETRESLGQMARRCGQTRDALAKITEGATSRGVAWMGARGRGVAVGISPVSVGDVLRKELLDKLQSVIFTSATLTTGGDFTFIRQRLGIDFEVDEVRLPSPFDYPAQAAFYVSRELPDPRDPRFVARATREILALTDITGGGAFILCTSYRAMNAFARSCRPTLVDRGHPVLMQGEMPKATLLNRFREAGDAVLFATSSFWEGIDVPGQALRLVVMDKLPFQVPSDPLVKARCQAAEEEGRKPFMELLVPAAALSLKQGFGRLIRSRQDRGIVALLDGRVLSKAYGQVFLDTLPPASRCYSLDEARACWSVMSGDRMR